jgi:Fe-S cluster biosynthesis and repair protein YggX
VHRVHGTNTPSPMGPMGPIGPIGPPQNGPLPSPMDTAQRIAQFENMVRPEADPNNDMAWFSLAGAYADAGRHKDAALAFERCIQLNPGFSKAYQLAGAAYLAAGDEADGGRVLEEGFRAAAKRGDRMPQKAMGEMLAAIGRALPEVSVGASGQTASGTAAGSGFLCRRSGREGTKMTRPPFKGPVGEWIASNISRETFDEWIRQGTKVINELRLDLSREQDEEQYDAHMREYLGIDEELYAKLTAGKEGTAGS